MPYVSRATRAFLPRRASIIHDLGAGGAHRLSTAFGRAIRRGARIGVACRRCCGLLFVVVGEGQASSGSARCRCWATISAAHGQCPGSRSSVCRPVQITRAARCSSRRRSRFGSALRCSSGPRVCVQVRRSAASRRSRARSGSARSRAGAGYAALSPSGCGSGPRSAPAAGPQLQLRELGPGPSAGVLVANTVIRLPSASVKRSWAPRWGRSRRAVTRSTAGSPRRSGRGAGW